MPIKYDRELVTSTISAIDRVAAIKARRERAFYAARISASAPVTRKSLATEVVKDRHVLGMREDECTQKAVKAAETRLAKIAARELEQKQARMRPSSAVMETDASNDMHLDVTTQAISDALLSTGDLQGAQDQKIRHKIKVKSSRSSKTALVASGGQTMDLD